MPLFLGEDKISRVTISVESVDGGTNTNDATLSSGAQMLQGVTAYSKGAKYTGTIATVEGATPNISVSSDGLIAASVSNPKGYQSESTTKTTTQQLTTKGETTITPSSASQTAVNSGVYTTGKITVSAVPTQTKTITANGTYNPTSGKYFSSVTVNVAGGESFNTQTKSVSPTESEQTITPDTGYDGLSSVTVGAISSTYVGSGVPTQGAKTVTPSTSAKTAVSSGTYVTGDVTVDAIPSNYIDTSDADATASDIVANKTAYVNGIKVTGSVAEHTSNQDRFYGTNATTLAANYGNTLYIGAKKPINEDLLLRRIADNG